MLSKFKVEHYKSLFDTEIDLESLTVFIGPNGSGKSNICESLALLSNIMNIFDDNDFIDTVRRNDGFNIYIKKFLSKSIQSISKNQANIESKFWRRKLDYFSFMVSSFQKDENKLSKLVELSVTFNYPKQNIEINLFENGIEKSNNEGGSSFTLFGFAISLDYPDSFIKENLRKVCIYDFSPFNLTNEIPSTGIMDRTGEGIAYALADILFSNRKSFDELEERLRLLVPNIQRISLLRGKNQTFSLQLVDRYSETPIPASDISDGTLRILAFLTALYQEDTPSIICFEEIENGVHPWLLHKMMELLKVVSTEGITGKPVQVLITTHSPTLLNYVEPYQVRAVELDNEGKTQVHKLPTDSLRFQKALEAYDGSLGELWFTNQFGGNPV